MAASKAATDADLEAARSRIAQASNYRELF